MTHKIYILKPGAPDWDAKKQTYKEYVAEHCIDWDTLTPEEQADMANRINNKAMAALGYAPVKEGATA